MAASLFAAQQARHPLSSIIGGAIRRGAGPSTCERAVFVTSDPTASFPLKAMGVVDVSTPERAAGLTNERQHAAIPMLLAVIGSVAGTLVTSA